MHSIIKGGSWLISRPPPGEKKLIKAGGLDSLQLSASSLKVGIAHEFFDKGPKEPPPFFYTGNDYPFLG